jgi:ankyrin repeat protein
MAQEQMQGHAQNAKMPIQLDKCKLEPDNAVRIESLNREMAALTFNNAPEDIANAARLVEAGANPNILFKHGQTALLWALDCGCTEVARFLIEKGTDVNIRGICGYTALVYASCSGNTAIARLLLEKGADVNARSHGEYTLLMYTSIHGRIETARLLLMHGADLDTRNDDGRNARGLAELNTKRNNIVLLDFWESLQKPFGKEAFAAFLLDFRRCIGQ